jgi:hypothetical protein
MNVKRILILGIDAIEHDLVEQWDLKNLKQKEYGKTILPIYGGEEPNTRIVWPCFICGCMPKDMGYVTSRVFPKPLQFFVNIFSPIIKSSFNPQTDAPEDITVRQKNPKLGAIMKFYDIFEKLDMARNPTRNDIKSSTMFDDDPRRISLHVPIYNEWLPDICFRTIEAIEDKNYRPIFNYNCLKEFNNRSNEIMSWLKKKDEWDLFMNYFWFLDGIQHVYFNNPRKIAKFYIMVDEFIKKLTKKLDSETMLLIVSDHGQKKGIHTPHGFYSTNMKLGLKNPKLIDFRWIIEELLNK